ncbi:GNAT family N-acetyltransferase [Aliivibrio kagoshimensis]|uniref:GNAT family N-acetyltransferase n=1 Tax=Aliivibrio kagoshimensis TaxID=2910230 RepID=UPI003D1501ED
MNISGKRIKLAPFDESDKELFIQISICPFMMEHVYDPFTYEDAEKAFEAKSQKWNLDSSGWLALGITDLSSGEKLGNIGLKIVNHTAKIAEVGFMIKQQAQGKGIASEALELVKNFAYKELKLNKLVATCSVNNEGSYRLLEKIGFIREGCLQQNSLIKGQRIDDYIYGLCKSAL